MLRLKLFIQVKLIFKLHFALEAMYTVLNEPLSCMTFYTTCSKMDKHFVKHHIMLDTLSSLVVVWRKFDVILLPVDLSFCNKLISLNHGRFSFHFLYTLNFLVA